MHQICQFHLSTFREPGDGVFVVDVSAWRAVDGSFRLICQLKVQDKHDDYTILILNWNHIHKARQTHTCVESGKSEH